MAFKLNPLTGELQLYNNAASGGVTGIPPTHVGAIAQWANTGGTVIADSPGTNVQASGAIEAQMFITNRRVNGTVTINGNESAISPGLQLQPGAVIIIQPGGELIVI